MLFDKHIEPNCVYCLYYLEVEENSGLCRKRGPVMPWGSCRRFHYDPLKRKPPEKPEKLPAYEEETIKEENEP